MQFHSDKRRARGFLHSTVVFDGQGHAREAVDGVPCLDPNPSGTAAEDRTRFGLAIADEPRLVGLAGRQDGEILDPDESVPVAKRTDQRDGRAALFAVTGILVLFCVQHVEATTAPTLGWWKHARSMPAALLLMVPLATGIESAAGGWLAAYSKRSGHTLGIVIGAATCFWGGLLLSRLLQSSRKVAARSVRLSLALNPWLIAAGLALLVSTGNLVSNGDPVFNGNQAAILVAALLIGFGVGPMYPSLLALVLERGEGGNAVFVMAGVGAAVFPLLTGLVSGWTGSLRLGLCVPLAGALVMAWCGWRTSQAESF